MTRSYLTTVISDIVADLTCKRILVLSDVHLGHPNTPTWHIVNSLDKHITNPDIMQVLDAVFITGDLFDRNLKYNNLELCLIEDWFTGLLRLAKRFNVAVRILEGTPSHDWKQCAKLITLNETLSINADLKYYHDIHVEYDESLDMVLGYIPDEARESNDVTTAEFKELMKTKGFGKVDAMLMHGMFEFQVPNEIKHLNLPVFKSEDYEDIINYFIAIGHDHKHKYKDFIYVPSSWDRLALNEEDLKGCMLFDIKSGSVKAHRLVNPDAAIYKTLKAANLNHDDLLRRVGKELEPIIQMDTPVGKLAIEHDSQFDISKLISEHNKAFQYFKLQGKKISPEHVSEVSVADMQMDIAETINITPENVTGMIYRQLGIDVDESLSKEIEHVMGMV